VFDIKSFKEVMIEKKSAAQAGGKTLLY